jgi:hypothetical protein
MSGITLRTQAIKVTNKGGGHKTSTVVEETKTELGKVIRKHKHYETKDRVPGTDYVTFKCPGCGKRNKQSMYELKGKMEDDLVFQCNGCLRDILVARPTEAIKLITVPDAGMVDGRGNIHAHGLVGPNGRPV